eukprot:CAMPEP_0172704422 /NCGR_PEP_ID=MMETSP1074-20121228/41424_1 /TAXON_ID=2916 /ORGANISM="Ceratium fusus, Strain PA161109" /LENGTH=62 /DNA_ID=CAMNT_0013526579 /DNA_START=12 /DNA_END=196 /DNA_ORIENTATION=-
MDPQDPLTEYAPDNLERLRESEIGLQIDADYMQRQTEINGRMRGILVDWLSEVVTAYKLKAP